jgi:DNA-binding NarL/FixJ family response regulator
MRAEAVVLDPHPILHSAIQRLLGRVDISLVAATTSPSRALHMIVLHHPELFVVEPLLPETEVISGLACIERSLAADPLLTVVALAGGEGRWLRRAALSRGVAAFVWKSAPVTAIEAVITDALERARCGGETLVSGLTPRERQILALVAEHRTNAEVAQMLWLSQDTVKFHLANAFRKLHVSSRTEAARWARRHGLTDQEPDAAESLRLTTTARLTTTHALAGRQAKS